MFVNWFWLSAWLWLVLVRVVWVGHGRLGAWLCPASPAGCGAGGGARLAPGSLSPYVVQAGSACPRRCGRPAPTAFNRAG